MSSASAVSTLIPAPSRARRLSGRVITAVVAVFLLFDGITKLFKERHVLQAAKELGYSTDAMIWIGLVLLACTVVYLIPKTSVLGAIFLTGYLGGAVASNVRIEHPTVACLFPIIFGVLVWAGLFLREPLLSVVLSVRTNV